MRARLGGELARDDDCPAAAPGGPVVWNGATYWAGGHIGQVTISDITLVPQPRLIISRAGSASVRIVWATHFTEHVLEHATAVPGVGWSTVTNAVTTVADRLSVTVATDAAEQFYRLRKP